MSGRVLLPMKTTWLIFGDETTKVCITQGKNGLSMHKMVPVKPHEELDLMGDPSRNEELFLNALKSTRDSDEENLVKESWAHLYGRRSRDPARYAKDLGPHRAAVLVDQLAELLDAGLDIGFETASAVMFNQLVADYFQEHLPNVDRAGAIEAACKQRHTSTDAYAIALVEQILKQEGKPLKESRIRQALRNYRNKLKPIVEARLGEIARERTSN